MSQQDFNRRDFTQLAAAAMSGIVAGAAMPAFATDEVKKEGKKELHVCRGLNTCKTNGAGGKNDCAGTGICATAAKITCAGQNACKGQGGCGKTPGENACKGEGGCHVPLNAGAWKVARKRFEERMKKADKKFGPAPEPAKPKK